MCKGVVRHPFLHNYIIMIKLSFENIRTKMTSAKWMFCVNLPSLYCLSCVGLWLSAASVKWYWKAYVQLFLRKFCMSITLGFSPVFYIWFDLFYCICAYEVVTFYFQFIYYFHDEIMRVENCWHETLGNHYSSVCIVFMVQHYYLFSLLMMFSVNILFKL